MAFTQTLRVFYLFALHKALILVISNKKRPHPFRCSIGVGACAFIGRPHFKHVSALLKSGRSQFGHFTSSMSYSPLVGQAQKRLFKSFRPSFIVYGYPASLVNLLQEIRYAFK